jgi:hypothetical protein
MLGVPPSESCFDDGLNGAPITMAISMHAEGRPCGRIRLAEAAS